MRHKRDKYAQSKGIKPKNRVFCPDSMRLKMKFNTQKEAEDFIKWNHDHFENKIPSRVYWCDACCGYHITARPEGDVGVTVNMTLPYLTDALETDKFRVIRTVKMLHNVLNILKQPSGYYGKIGLGKCKSILDCLTNSNNPYYLEEREKLQEIVNQQRDKYKPVWMKRKYCHLVKTKLYRDMCNVDWDEQTVLDKYIYDLKYILYLADNDQYDLNDLPELFLEEWETLFRASSVSNHLTDKMIPDGTDKDNQNEETFSEEEEHGPGMQVSNQGEGF